MKVPTLNSKARWRFGAQFLFTDPVTKVQTPIDLTGSTLRLTFTTPDGTVAGEAVTGAGIVVTVSLEGRVQIDIPVEGRPEIGRFLPVSLAGDVYRSVDDSEPTEWLARIPATLIAGA
jgi:hypothetical protein